MIRNTARSIIIISLLSFNVIILSIITENHDRDSGCELWSIMIYCMRTECLENHMNESRRTGFVADVL